MNSDHIRQKYGIPAHVVWGSQRPTVFDKLENEFMLDCLDSIDYLLNSTSIEVIIYNGSFDLIVDTPGIKVRPFFVSNSDSDSSSFANPHKHSLTPIVTTQLTSWPSPN